MGNLTRDPELRYVPSGTAVASFDLAVNRAYSTQTGEKKNEAGYPLTPSRVAVSSNLNASPRKLVVPDFSGLISSAMNLDSFSLYNRVGFRPRMVFQDTLLSVPETG